MRMRDWMQAGMVEATRLTRQGRLVEATAVIQRTLRCAPAPGASPKDSASASEPIEADFRVIDEGSLPTEIPTPDAPDRYRTRR